MPSSMESWTHRNHSGLARNRRGSIRAAAATALQTTAEKKEENMSDAIRLKGAFRKFIKDKRCGFIYGENGQEFFFHCRDVRGLQSIDPLPAIGARVTFLEIPHTDTMKRSMAIDIEVL